MKEIIEWLSSVERLSNDFYGAAAALFREDSRLCGFLEHLAADEKWHDHIIRIAGQNLQNRQAPLPGIAVDLQTREKIETPFRLNSKKLDSGTLTRDDVIECIIASEFSEWNDIFLYVVNSMKETGNVFEPVAAKMQQHKRFIEAYLEALPAPAGGVDRLRSLRPLWHERILVVDDYPPLREFLAALLSTRGMVDQAENGQEGLQKTRAHYYDVIVSDVDMPAMGGIEFYREALKTDPRIGGRFLFLSGDPEDEVVEFFKQNGLFYLIKPSPLREIAAAVESILLAEPGRASAL